MILSVCSRRNRRVRGTVKSRWTCALSAVTLHILHIKSKDVELKESSVALQLRYAAHQLYTQAINSIWTQLISFDGALIEFFPFLISLHLQNISVKCPPSVSKLNIPNRTHYLLPHKLAPHDCYPFSIIGTTVRLLNPKSHRCFFFLFSLFPFLFFFFFLVLFHP